jgi:uncharacterized protein YggE
MAVAEAAALEAARQQAIANAEAEAQRAAAEAERAAQRLASLRQLPNASFRMNPRVSIPSFLEHNPLHLQQQGMENQERFVLRLLNE